MDNWVDLIDKHVSAGISPAGDAVLWIYSAQVHTVVLALDFPETSKLCSTFGILICTSNNRNKHFSPHLLQHLVSDLLTMAVLTGVRWRFKAVIMYFLEGYRP